MPFDWRVLLDELDEFDADLFEKVNLPNEFDLFDEGNLLDDESEVSDDFDLPDDESEVPDEFNVPDDFDLPDEFGPEVFLVKIELRERTLASSRSSNDREGIKGPGKIGKHDFILLTVIDKERRLFSFVAEKMKEPKSCRGLRSYVRLVPLRRFSSKTSAIFWERDKQNDSPKSKRILTLTSHQYSLDVIRSVEDQWGLCSPKFRSASRSRFVWELDTPTVVCTTKLKDSLRANGEHYNVLSNNCWNYATHAVKGVLDLCKKVRGYEEALQRLKMVERVLPYDYIRLLGKPWSSKNGTTRQRIANLKESSSRSDKSRDVHRGGPMVPPELKLETRKRPPTLDFLRFINEPFSYKTLRETNDLETLTFGFIDEPPSSEKTLHEINDLETSFGFINEPFSYEKTLREINDLETLFFGFINDVCKDLF